jgi:hypothetical protein
VACKSRGRPFHDILLLLLVVRIVRGVSVQQLSEYRPEPNFYSPTIFVCIRKQTI